MTTITKEERIAQIERALFIMEFKDHWTNADWQERAKLNTELQILKNN